MGIRYLCQFCRKLSKELWRNFAPAGAPKAVAQREALGGPACRQSADGPAGANPQSAGRESGKCRVLSGRAGFSHPTRSVAFVNLPPVPHVVKVDSDQLQIEFVGQASIADPRFELGPPLKTPMRESSEPSAHLIHFASDSRADGGWQGVEGLREGCRPNLKRSRHSINLAGGSCISLPRSLAAIGRGWLLPRRPIQVRPQDNPQSKREALRRPDAAIWELPLQFPELRSCGKDNQTNGF